MQDSDNLNTFYYYSYSDYLITWNIVDNLTIPCKLLDTDGCKANLKVSIVSEEVHAGQVPKLDQNYQTIGSISYDQDKIVMRYTVRFTNLGASSIESMQVGVRLDPEQEGGDQYDRGAKLTHYSMNPEIPKVDIQEMPFKINPGSRHFHETGIFIANEEAVLTVIIEYDKGDYGKHKKGINIFELTCNECQVSFQKLVHR